MHQMTLWEAPSKDEDWPGLPPLDGPLSTHYTGFLDEDVARRNALRLIVTGYSGSGKTTMLHQLLSHALGNRAERWSEILILDGKQSSLSWYANLEGVTYFGPWQVEQWAKRLRQLSGVLGERFKRQQQGADPGRWLIVVDEVQRGTRAKKIGQSIRNSLDMLAEQSDALGDVLVVAAQRELNAIPVSVRENKHGQLMMLTKGYYYLKLDTGPAWSGRAPFITPADALQRAESSPNRQLNLEIFSHHLAGSAFNQRYHPRVTLYLGSPGQGKTHSLLETDSRQRRKIYVNLAQASREALAEMIEKAGVVLPSTATLRTGELVELVALSLQAEPTLLLLDDVDQANMELIVALERLIQSAAEVVLAANRPQTPTQREKMEMLYPRCEVLGVRRLDNDSARQLLWSVLDRSRFKRPQAVERKILLEAGGNPAHLVSLARRVGDGSPADLRRVYLQQMNQVNLQWVFLLIVVGVLIALRRYVHDSFVMLVAISMAYIILRRRLYRRD